MPSYVSTVTDVLGALTILLDVFIVAAVLSMLLMLVSRGFRRSLFGVTHHLGKHALVYGFVLTLAATLGSLFYSNIAGFTPCNLCWWQRIFMYPLPLLFLVLLVRGQNTGRDERTIVYQSSLMAVIGAAIALFHWWGQLFNNSALPCPPGGVSCASAPFANYGYITIPMMALSVFLAVIILMIARSKYLTLHASR
jgi:disulfide bond formation protein DsbB